MLVMVMVSNSSSSRNLLELVFRLVCLPGCLDVALYGAHEGGGDRLLHGGEVLLDRIHHLVHQSQVLRPKVAPLGSRPSLDRVPFRQGLCLGHHSGDYVGGLPGRKQNKRKEFSFLLKTYEAKKKKEV